MPFRQLPQFDPPTPRPGAEEQVIRKGEHFFVRKREDGNPGVDRQRGEIGWRGGVSSGYYGGNSLPVLPLECTVQRLSLPQDDRDKVNGGGFCIEILHGEDNGLDSLTAQEASGLGCLTAHDVPLCFAIENNRDSDGGVPPPSECEESENCDDESKKPFFQNC